MAKASETLVLPALRGTFGDWIYYSCLMPLDELGARTKYATEIHKSAILSDFIQRSLEGARAGHIAEYLQKTPDRFFNSLVLAVYGGSPEWLEIGGLRARDPALGKVLSQQAEDSIGFLQLSGKEDIFAIDGQHRLAGIKKALEGGGATSTEQVSVLLVAHKKTIVGLQRTRRLFTTLNKTAVPVRKRDIIALDEDDAMAITTRRLVETDPRFATPRIAIIASQSIPSHNAICLTTISSLYDILKLLLVHANGRRSDRGLKFNRPTDERLDYYHEQADEYFTALEDTFKPIREVMTSLTPELVTPRHRHSGGGHLLFRPIGLELFTRTVIRYAQDGDISLPDAVKALRRMPMALDAEPFDGVIWDSGREVMKTDGKTLARDLMFYMAGITHPTKALLENYRRQRGFSRNDASIQLPKVL